MKEIILPYHLFQRIKASAGEHGGVGAGSFFTMRSEPLCVHGHAWGTLGRCLTEGGESLSGEEPELARYISYMENDDAVDEVLIAGGNFDWLEDRIPFDQWCRRLNVKCGPKPEASNTAKESFANYAESLP